MRPEFWRGTARCLAEAAKQRMRTSRPVHSQSRISSGTAHQFLGELGSLGLGAREVGNEPRPGPCDAQVPEVPN